MKVSIFILAFSFFSHAANAQEQFIWKAKVLGSDQRELIDSNTRLVIRTPGGGGFCSGAMISRTLMITAAHCIVSEGKWIQTNATSKPTRDEFNENYVAAEGCLSTGWEKWKRVKNMWPATMQVSKKRVNEHTTKDFAIVELESRVCAHARISVPFELSNEDWWIGRENEIEIRSSYSQGSVQATADRNNRVLHQSYRSTGKFINFYDQYGPNGQLQRMCQYEIDTDGGASGSAIVPKDSSTRTLLCLHIGSLNGTHNFGIKYSNAFKEFVEGFIPKQD